MRKFDERDTIFSRLELIPGTVSYDEYYARHPEKRQVDDGFRETGAEFADHIPLRLLTESTFRLLADIRPLARGSASPGKTMISPETATATLKSCAESYGAVLFGIAPLGDICFYSTRGRGSEYGTPVQVPGKQGIVFAVRMNPVSIASAPAPEEAAEVVNGYTRVAVIGLVLSYCIRGWGWEAACTMDGRADLVLPVAARYAGLGSIGRSGLLLTREYGPCVRLGAVVTDMPLQRTEAMVSASSLPCETCNLCAQKCPANAIDDRLGRKFRFRPVNDEACYSQWKRMGTDCGICVARCPLSGIPSGRFD